MAKDKQLSTYKSKRDFRISPEPSGDGKTSRRGNRPIFVIQEHEARSHHFDFRLEVDGVLKSWAVPKGPSTDPREKRLAVETEDHPLDYADFEGVIPEGEYGAGTVIVWDAGPYRNLRGGKKKDKGRADMEASYEDGRIEVWVEGKKLRGGYALVKTGRKNQWLLIKMKDDEADARRNPVSTQPKSVLSGKTIKQMKRAHTEEDD